MSKRSLSIRIISVFLALTFIAGQVYATPLGTSSSKLSPSLASDPNINPLRQPARNEITGTLHSGAIGKGDSLEIINGNLPPRISIDGPTAKKIRDAINEALQASYDSKPKFSQLTLQNGLRQRLSIVHETENKLIELYDQLSNMAYLYNAVVEGPEDYLLGFNNKDYIGLSVELIDRLSPRLLAQYIFHECIPEGLISRDRDIGEGHRIAYSEIQPLVFGSTMTVLDPVTKVAKSVSEVDALKIELRRLIDELSPAPGQASSLEEALSLIRQYKAQSRQGASNDNNAALLKAEALKLYNEYKLYELPLQGRVRFCLEVFDHTSFPRVNEAIRSIFDTVVLSRPRNSLDPDGAFTVMPPSMYHALSNVLSKIEGTHTLAENDNIRFAVDSILFDFLRPHEKHVIEGPHEKRVIELLWLTGEIEKELEKQGNGELPMIAAMQDLHGGARRALSLIGFALGLPKDCYNGMYTLSDLQNALAASGIDVADQDTRIIGLNDKYDRGEDPEGVFELVKWLRDIGKAKPFVGNHDFWRAMSVLGVHLIPEKVSKTPKDKFMEGQHGVGFWSQDAMVHAGWGTIELDQINERRFNAEIARVNGELKQKGHSLLKPIDLRDFRNKINGKMKELKDLNKVIRKENESRKKEPGYVCREPHKLPDIFTDSLAHLKKQVADRNREIATLNTKYGWDISAISFQEVNLGNYMDDPDVVARALWELQNFRLFYIDVLGNIHMHSLIPLDFENRKIDVKYKDKQGIPALEMMQGEIRHFFEGMDTIPNTAEFRATMWKSIGSAFTEINRWYSDKGAYAKAASVKEFTDKGGPAGFNNEFIGSAVTQFADRYATFLMVIGHNERKKFDDAETSLPWITLSPESGSGLANIDYEMSEGYSDRGAIVTLFKRDENGKITGIRQWGYPVADKAIGQKQAGVVDIQDITMTDIEGLNKQESDMLKDLSDGEKFMRWYRLKALREVEVLLAALIADAGKTGRVEKEEEYKKVQAAITKKIAVIEGNDVEGARRNIVSPVPVEYSQSASAISSTYYDKLSTDAERAYIDGLSEKYGGGLIVRNVLAGARLGSVTRAELLIILSSEGHAVTNELAYIIYNEARKPIAMAAPESADRVLEEVVAEILARKDINAMRFIAQLTAINKILENEPGQQYFIGFETGLGGLQQGMMQIIAQAIEQIKNKRGSDGELLFPNLERLIVKRESAEKLESEVKGRNQGGVLALNRVLIAARLESITANKYDGIQGSERAWIAAIDDSGSESYLPLFEAITLNMMASLGAEPPALKRFYNEISNNPLDLDVLQDMFKSRVIYIYPKATKVDLAGRRKLYELVVESINKAA